MKVPPQEDAVQPALKTPFLRNGEKLISRQSAIAFAKFRFAWLHGGDNFQLREKSGAEAIDNSARRITSLILYSAQFRAPVVSPVQPSATVERYGR